MDDSPRSYQLSLEKNPTEMTGFNCTKSGHTHQIGAFLSQRPEPNMSTDDLIELARQADAIFGAQDDGIDGFETQMRRVVTHGHRVGSDAIEVVVADIEAAMFVCGFELIRSRDDAVASGIRCKSGGCRFWLRWVMLRRGANGFGGAARGVRGVLGP